MASVPSPRGAAPRSPVAGSQAKGKTPGLQDAKARQLEWEFKIKHAGLLGVLAWIL